MATAYQLLTRSLLLAALVGGAIAGCSLRSPAPPLSPTPAASPATTSDATGWTPLFPGHKTADLTFTSNAELALQNKILLPNIPVSYNASDTPATYAARLSISPTSPSGRYSIVKACEDPNPGTGLCWSIYKVDRQQQTAQKVSIGKYGGMDWVQWSLDERYAVFLEKLEGSSWFVVLDLERGDSMVLEEIPAVVNLEQFRWTGERTFSVPLGDGSTFEGDITTLAFSP